jgi:ABC-2 type transport system ATP-binding protein
MSLLTLENVSKRFGSVTAVDDVSFSVDRGQVVGFLGPNGAGKSTTMRVINQYFEPDAGQVRLDGKLLGEIPREAKRRIGYLPENNPLYSDMLVTDYLRFVAELRELGGPELDRAIDYAVASTGIAEVFYRPIGELSKGYRQRVGLAQAILNRPDLLVLDEPTEGLDPNQRVEIRKLIEGLGKEHTVILSTHVLPEVQHTCTRLLVIHQGKIAADGPVEQLMAQASGAVQVSVEVEGSGVVDDVSKLKGVMRVNESHREATGRVSLVLTAEASADVRPAIFELAKAREWRLYELHQETRSLEDVFQELTTTTTTVEPE